jgi:hypothetical protein
VPDAKVKPRGLFIGFSDDCRLKVLVRLSRFGALIWLFVQYAAGLISVVVFWAWIVRLSWASVLAIAEVPTTEAGANAIKVH